MVERELGIVTATNLIDRAAEMLAAVGESASALRLRRTLAIIRNDVDPVDLDRTTRVALSLMRMALALMDFDGAGHPNSPLLLQAAIDVTRGARPLQPGEELDPDLIDAFAEPEFIDMPAEPVH